VLFLFLGITIAAVSVLAIHKRLRPSFPADCQFLGLHNYSRVFHFAAYIQSDCYNRPGRPAFPLEVILECCGREQEMGPLCF
jgi:hypothetical protein